MQKSCYKCKKSFDKNTEDYCKKCYELIILEAQCLNIAGNIVTPETANRVNIAKEVIELKNKLFEEAKTSFKKW